MAPKNKGENSRKAAGNAKKAESAANKKAVESHKQESEEQSKWQQGAKDNSKAYVDGRGRGRWTAASLTATPAMLQQ